MDTLPVISSRRTRHSMPKSFLRLTLSLSLMLLAATHADAQYGGGGGMGGGTGTSPGTYTPPKSGYSSATGAAIGAGAAAGAGVLFLALHYHGRVTGCVQPTDDGLRLLDEKKNVSYALVPGDVYLKPGQRVELKGQKSKNEAGTQTFKAKKLVKDLGACKALPSASSGSQAPRQ